MGILFSTPEHQRLQWWNSPFPNPSVHQTIIIIIVAVIVVIPFLIHLFPLKLSPFAQHFPLSPFPSKA